MKSFIGEKVFVVAEIGANHRQYLKDAHILILAAKKAGADAIKIQMFTPDSLASKDGSKLKTGLWAGKTLYELYEKACTPYGWVPRLKKFAEGLELKFFTTVYDIEALSVAEQIGIEAYKIASYEITELDLIEAVGQTKKPVIISTGSATEKEILNAKDAVGHSRVAFLKCTSNYPTLPEDANLKTILDMRRWLRWVGLSDHTTSIAVPVAAVALGARIIEKHIKITEDCLDAAFSLNPLQFKAMVTGIRTAEKALGKIEYGGTRTIVRKKVGGKSVRVIIERDENVKE